MASSNPALAAEFPTSCNVLFAGTTPADFVMYGMDGAQRIVFGISPAQQASVMISATDTTVSGDLRVQGEVISVYTSNLARSAAFSSNTAFTALTSSTFASNASVFASNLNPRVTFSSNAADFASNLQPNVAFSSNTSISASNTASAALAGSTFSSNASVFASNLNPRVTFSSNAASFASNLAVAVSLCNDVWLPKTGGVISGPLAVNANATVSSNLVVGSNLTVDGVPYVCGREVLYAINSNATTNNNQTEVFRLIMSNVNIEGGTYVLWSSATFTTSVASQVITKIAVSNFGAVPATGRVIHNTSNDVRTANRDLVVSDVFMMTLPAGNNVIFHSLQATSVLSTLRMKSDKLLLLRTL